MDKMDKIISLCKRRGFIFQNSEIYGGLKSSYDYGPLGVEFKRNIADLWWREMVHGRDNIYGLDAAIIMHPKVWKTSGHLSNFSDPLVDCFDCKSRFRPDKLPQLASGTKIEYEKKQKGKKIKLEGNVGSAGVVCPNCGSPNLSEIRQFRGMFESVLGPVDPLNAAVNKFYSKGLSQEEFLKCIREQIDKDTVYLRPETAQGIYVNYQLVQGSTRMKIPFGIAQIGKAFRNEIIARNFIFRTREFEQMEMQYFTKPGQDDDTMKAWKEKRMNFYTDSLGISSENLRFHEHGDDELAHYAKEAWDIEYNFPFGWSEVEGIHNRTDFDLKNHEQFSGKNLKYFDQENNERYLPYIIETSAGLNRMLLTVLSDSYWEDTENNRKVMKFDPKIAPIKAVICPLVKKDGLPEKARSIIEVLKPHFNVLYDQQGSIGKRYYRQDEAGTPFGITVDHQTMDDDTITIRYRDSQKQDRSSLENILKIIQDSLI